MAEDEYVIQYRSDRGEWVEWQVYAGPLDADRAYERLRQMHPARRIRVVRRKIIVESEE